MTLLTLFFAAFVIGFPIGYLVGYVLCLNSPSDSWCGLNIIGLIPLTTVIVFILLWLLFKLRILSESIIRSRTASLILGVLSLILLLYFLRELGLLRVF